MSLTIRALQPLQEWPVPLPEPGQGRPRTMLPDPSRAACLGEDPELFFPETQAQAEVAKSVCADCPIRRECLAGALLRREPHGVWGGELFLSGVVIAQKRPRGRPRKTFVTAA